MTHTPPLKAYRAGDMAKRQAERRSEAAQFAEMLRIIHAMPPLSVAEVLGRSRG